MANNAAAGAQPALEDGGPVTRGHKHPWRTRVKIAWKKTSLNNKITIVLTFIIAMTSAGNLYVMHKQLEILNGTSEQTGKLIDAANIQATASQRNAKAAEDFAATAKEQAQASQRNAKAAEDFATTAKVQSDNLGAVAKQAAIQAAATNAFASETRRSADIADAALASQQRPWMGYVEVNVPEDIAAGSRVPVAVTFKNWGLSPALNEGGILTMRIYCGAFPERPEYVVGSALTHTAVMPNQTSITDTVRFPQPLTEDQIKIFKSGTCGLYVYATVTYKNLRNQPHWRHFCGIWNPLTPRTFNACNTYNDGDEDYKDGKEP
jgi:hypothetical protein